MCLLILAWRAHPNYRLILAGNRDEFHDRPTDPADFWPHQPDLLAGRDRQAGGTWLGVTRGQRFSVVTNFREPDPPPPHASSRGRLASDYLQGRTAPGEYARLLEPSAHHYAGFNLLIGDADGLYYVTNRADTKSGVVTPGLHGLSNHHLDTPWPKVQRSLQHFQRILPATTIAADDLFALLADHSPALDEELPDTGIDKARERVLSAPFVIDPAFGTRCSSVLLIDKHRRIQFIERGFNANGQQCRQREFELG